MGTPVVADTVDIPLVTMKLSDGAPGFASGKAKAMGLSTAACGSSR